MEEIKQDKKSSYHEYNRKIEKKRKKKKSSSHSEKKVKSFSSQTINIQDLIYAPEGMEFVVYPLYFMLIPYIAGAIFLFFAVAGADFDNFMLLDLTQALIVWAIGYEIVATISLTWIFILFIKYDK